MNSFETRLVEAVKRKRIAEGLSLRGLSSVVGVSFSTLARIERGDGLPDNNSKIRLLEWLGPTAEAEGLGYENVALVHFRASKNARSQTVRALLDAADCLKRHSHWSDKTLSSPTSDSSPVSLLKEELESAAEKFRNDLRLNEEQPLDPLQLKIEGVDILRLTKTICLSKATVNQLSTESCDEWSAMSVPLDAAHEHWSVLLNDCHTVERQRVTLLEELWHILLGHKLTKIAKVAGAYGRTYDSAEEHDAYYLASATLLPRTAVARAVAEGLGSIKIGAQFGTSAELVDYRIKRMGLWREHVGKKVSLSP